MFETTDQQSQSSIIVVSNNNVVVNNLSHGVTTPINNSHNVADNVDVVDGAISALNDALAGAIDHQSHQHNGHINILSSYYYCKNIVEFHPQFHQSQHLHYSISNFNLNNKNYSNNTSTDQIQPSTSNKDKSILDDQVFSPITHSMSANCSKENGRDKSSNDSNCNVISNSLGLFQLPQTNVLSVNQNLVMLIPNDNTSFTDNNITTVNSQNLNNDSNNNCDNNFEIQLKDFKPSVVSNLSENGSMIIESYENNNNNLSNLKDEKNLLNLSTEDNKLRLNHDINNENKKNSFGFKILKNKIFKSFKYGGIRNKSKDDSHDDSKVSSKIDIENANFKPTGLKAKFKNKTNIRSYFNANRKKMILRFEKRYFKKSCNNNNNNLEDSASINKNEFNKMAGSEMNIIKSTKELKLSPQKRKLSSSLLDENYKSRTKSINSFKSSNQLRMNKNIPRTWNAIKNKGEIFKKNEVPKQFKFKKFQTSIKLNSLPQLKTNYPNNIYNSDITIRKQAENELIDNISHSSSISVSASNQKENLNDNDISIQHQDNQNQNIFNQFPPYESIYYRDANFQINDTSKQSNYTNDFITNDTLYEHSSHHVQQQFIYDIEMIPHSSQNFFIQDNRNTIYSTIIADTSISSLNSQLKQDLLKLSYEKFKQFRLNEKLLHQTVLIRNAIKLLQFDLQCQQEQEQLIQQHNQIIKYDNSINSLNQNNHNLNYYNTCNNIDDTQQNLIMSNYNNFDDFLNRPEFVNNYIVNTNNNRSSSYNNSENKNKFNNNFRENEINDKSYNRDYYINNTNSIESTSSDCYNFVLNNNDPSKKKIKKKSSSYKNFNNKTYSNQNSDSENEVNESEDSETDESDESEQSDDEEDEDDDYEGDDDENGTDDQSDKESSNQDRQEFYKENSDNNDGNNSDNRSNQDNSQSNKDGTNNAKNCYKINEDINLISQKIEPNWKGDNKENEINHSTEIFPSKLQNQIDTSSYNKI